MVRFQQPLREHASVSDGERPRVGDDVRPETLADSGLPVSEQRRDHGRGERGKLGPLGMLTLPFALVHVCFPASEVLKRVPLVLMISVVSRVPLFQNALHSNLVEHVPAAFRLVHSSHLSLNYA